MYAQTVISNYYNFYNPKVKVNQPAKNEKWN